MKAELFWASFLSSSGQLKPRFNGIPGHRHVFIPTAFDKANLLQPRRIQAAPCGAVRTDSCTRWCSWPDPVADHDNNMAFSCDVFTFRLSASFLL
jgi:hypothetical protein